MSAATQRTCTRSPAMGKGQASDMPPYMCMSSCTATSRAGAPCTHASTYAWSSLQRLVPVWGSPSKPMACVDSSRTGSWFSSYSAPMQLHYANPRSVCRVSHQSQVPTSHAPNRPATRPSRPRRLAGSAGTGYPHFYIALALPATTDPEFGTRAPCIFSCDHLGRPDPRLRPLVPRSSVQCSSDILAALSAPHQGTEEPIYPGTCHGNICDKQGNVISREQQQQQQQDQMSEPADAATAAEQRSSREAASGQRVVGEEEFRHTGKQQKQPPQQQQHITWRFRVPDGEEITFVDGHFGPQALIAGKVRKPLPATSRHFLTA
eukprot:365604-Chlamydomonas_euryale.AAC.6